jgi:hypothetical protein
MMTFQYTFVIYMVYCIVGSAVVTDCFLGKDAGCGPQPDRSRHGIARHPCGEYHTIETGFRGCLHVSVSVLRIRIRIHVFLDLQDPDPLVRGMDPDPDPSIIM